MSKLKILKHNRGMKRKTRDWRYCAYCGHHRRVYLKAHIGALDVVGCVVLGLMMMAPLSGGFDPRGLGLAAVFCGFAELFTGLRHRVNLKCVKCGFDPVVYRKSHEDAAKLVREHLEKRAQNPESLLADPVVPVMRKHKQGSSMASSVSRPTRSSRQTQTTNAPQQM